MLTIVFLTIWLGLFGQKLELKVGDEAPPLYIQQWLKGTPVTTFKKGHVYVLEFGATHCAPCRVIAPHLTKLSAQYKNRATFISIHIWENDRRRLEDLSYIGKIDDYVTSMNNKIGFSVAADVPQQTTAETWMGAAEKSGIPTIFIIDQSGKVAWIGSPFSIDAVLEQVVAGTVETIANAHQQTLRDNKALKVGDPAPPLAISKWLKGQPASFEGRQSQSKDFVHLIVISKDMADMQDRKSVHLMTKLVHEYTNDVSILWVYSEPSEKHEEVQKFVEKLGEKVAFNVALDTNEKNTFNNWAKAAGRNHITAFIVDSEFRITWIGSPEYVEPALQSILIGADVIPGIETENQILASFNEIVGEWKNGNSQAMIKVDSLISMNPKNQYLYCLKYQFFFSHEEGSESKAKAREWLNQMLKTMPKNYFYWEYVLNDAVHAIRKHKHDYLDLLTPVIDRIVEESETDDLSAKFLRLKAQIYAELQNEKDPGMAAQMLKDFLQNSQITIDPKTKAMLTTDYYIYKCLSLSNIQAINTLVKEILNDDVAGLQLDRLINSLLAFKNGPDYKLMLKLAIRNLEDPVPFVEDEDRHVARAKACATLAKVYDVGGEIDKAYNKLMEAQKYSEQGKNEKIIEHYKDLLAEFKQRHSIN